MKIVFYNPFTNTEVGTWTRDGDTIVAEPRVQSILTSSLAIDGVEGSWTRYSSWTNGYLASVEMPDVEDKGLIHWLESLHPRARDGKFTHADIGSVDSGATAINKKDIKNLLADIEKLDGWQVTRGSKHSIVTPPDKSHPRITIPLTPGDHRSFANTLAQLRRAGYNDRKTR